MNQSFIQMNLKKTKIKNNLQKLHPNLIMITIIKKKLLQKLDQLMIMKKYFQMKILIMMKMTKLFIQTIKMKLKMIKMRILSRILIHTHIHTLILIPMKIWKHTIKVNSVQNQM